MQFRALGNTGRRVSAIGLGCEYLDNKPYAQVKETVDMALNHGVNLLDVFMPGTQVRENIAKALGSRRRDVMIQGHLGSTDVHKQYGKSRDLPTVQKYFEEMLRIFGGYIDFGMIFFLDSQEEYKEVFETEFATYALRLKERGDIGHIGFSSHNPATAMQAIHTGLPDLMMFSINPAFDMLPAEEYVFTHYDKGFGADLFRGIDPGRAELYRLCESKQIGVTVMKPFAAGKLLTPEHSPFAKALTPAQCIHYALSRPAVASVLPGCQTGAEVADVMRYFDLSEQERDYAEILSAGRNDFAGSCVYCSHCQPCPAQIDVAAVHRYLDAARLDPGAIPASVVEGYRALPYSHEACIGCGDCEKRCPFGVQIIDDIKEAGRLLGAR